MDPRLQDLVEGREPRGEPRFFEQWGRSAARAELEQGAAELEDYRRHATNFYHRVRALFFLEAIHRYFLPPHYPADQTGTIPFAGHQHALARRFEEAIEIYLRHQREHGASDALSSALAGAYHGLEFKTLAQQVQKTVRTVRGNQWMFRTGHPLDYGLALRRELQPPGGDEPAPILYEETPVRLDLSHSGWSDIFFLGMDYPEGAKVLNISIDLGVFGRDKATRPPVCGFLRVIDEPVLRLVSVDLGASADVATLGDLFDFAKDYLGLLKAAVIAAGIVPPGLEGSGHQLSDILVRLCGPGRGLELVSQVRDIPKGSRLAVSTNLLGCLIALLMRATGQTAALVGELSESERRTVASRAILGEWLGGSGGGWQDSGGVWPGLKLIEGELAQTGDVEFGVSRGRLLPRHHVFDEKAASTATRHALQDSLILVHGGMSQNVGPILEMVTEKYLLKLEREWQARLEAGEILQSIVAALRRGDVAEVAALTTRNFFGPIQKIIPWASNAYTERLIAEARQLLGPAFRGFIMLGGMSGGGMGFWVDPREKARARELLLELMRRTKTELQHALPFAMDPVVYDFTINPHGTHAQLLTGRTALFSPEYYLFRVPGWVRQDPRTLPVAARQDLDRFIGAHLGSRSAGQVSAALLQRLFPATGGSGGSGAPRTLREQLDANGFDPVQHEAIRGDLLAGRIGLPQNRLPVSATVDDVRESDVAPLYATTAADTAAGTEALRAGAVAVVTLAAGAGSRWTQGAGTVKALHPFGRFGGRHRSFLEVHLAKSRRAAQTFGAVVPHLFTTSYLTHEPIRAFLAQHGNFGYAGPLVLSAGKSIGLRLVPTARDLRFQWEEMTHQVLDVQQEKMRQSVRKALIEWAATTGEGRDYTDNVPLQCLHPVGHWFEIANLLRNGVLRDLLQQRPQLRVLLLHNIDTLGADLDPGVLGRHLRDGAALSFEVIRRRLEDRGGGLARVGGQLRLVEGMALAREEDEFKLTFYNTATCWISIDPLLALFGLDRTALDDAERVTTAVRRLAARMPTYVTLKDVKKRWGNGQEDIMPVLQWEKLWGDMTTLPEAGTKFFAVPRLRGQQLKEQAQLDGWLRDGSAAHIESLCAWE